jgi:hypothetical protein
MAIELKFLIDGLDRGQPLNPEDFAITINEDDSIGARIVSFENELTFGGDVYDYLYTKLETSGYCELVRVTVQYICASGTWQKLVDGYIIATECTFILDRCQVKTKLYDETFSTKINNNKSIPFSLQLTQSKNGQPVTPPTLRRLEIFLPATGIFEPLCAYGYPVYDVFRHLVNCMTDNLVDFESNYLQYTYPDVNIPAFTNGKVLRTRTILEMVCDFETLYNAMRTKLNLGMGFEKQANGRPLLRIEPISYFQQINASANLYDQPEIEMKFDTARLYQAVNFGNETVLEQGQCDGGNSSCTFTQTPFRGFRNERFGFVGECNTANILQLETASIIFDANTIEDVIAFAAEGYDESNFIIQSNYFEFNSNPNCLVAQPYDPYSLGQTVYNGVYTNERVSANWLSGYPNSLSSFLEGFNTVLTPFTANFSSGIANQIINQIECTDAQYVSILDDTGHFAIYLQQTSDPNNLYEVDTYTVPFAGVYTFSAGIIFEEMRDAANDAIDPTEWGRDRKLFIKQYDNTDTFVQEIEISNSGSSKVKAWSEITNYTIICNQGDKIRVDAAVKRATGGSIYISLQRFIDTAVINSVSRTSYFTGSGIPFDESTLNAVNIDDVQSYLYKFNRPLTMAEINAITSETSKPILLGRRDDSLAVIPTYIKTINIQSVMRKGAEFELRSNKLLP